MIFCRNKREASRHFFKFELLSEISHALAYAVTSMAEDRQDDTPHKHHATSQGDEQVNTEKLNVIRIKRKRGEEPLNSLRTYPLPFLLLRLDSLFSSDLSLSSPAIYLILTHIHQSLINA